MYQRRDYREDEKITVGFKASGKLATAVHNAAELAGFPSTTQWLRSIAVKAAAEALGVTPESLEPPPARPRLVPATTSPEAMAGVARVNAAVLDAQATIERLTKALQAVSGVAPVSEPPRSPTRRR